MPVSYHVGRRKMQPGKDLALAPVSWLTALVRDSEHCHDIALNLVKDRVRKVAENMPLDRILVFRPRQRIDSKLINCLKCPGSKSVRRNRAALEVPEKGLSDFRLRPSASGRIWTPKRITERSVVPWLPSKKRP